MGLSTEPMNANRAPVSRQSKTKYRAMTVRADGRNYIVSLTMLARPAEPRTASNDPSSDGDRLTTLGAMVLDSEFRIGNQRCAFKAQPGINGAPDSILIQRLPPAADGAPVASSRALKRRPTRANDPAFLRRCREAASLRPSLTSVGYFARNSNPIDPDGFFQWFQDWDSLRSHLTEIEPAIAIGCYRERDLSAHRPEYAVRTGCMQVYLESLKRSPYPATARIRAINRVLAPTQVTWMGTFFELCSARGGWAARSRRQFRLLGEEPDERRDESPVVRSLRLTAPLSRSERKRFARYVTIYGH